MLSRSSERRTAALRGKGIPGLPLPRAPPSLSATHRRWQPSHVKLLTLALMYMHLRPPPRAITIHRAGHSCFPHDAGGTSPLPPAQHAQSCPRVALPGHSTLVRSAQRASRPWLSLQAREQGIYPFLKEYILLRVKGVSPTASSVVYHCSFYYLA